MYEQINIFDYLNNTGNIYSPKYERLNVGDKVGRIILGEVEIGTIEEVDGNKKNFFYRTDHGCFEAGSRTDIEEMQREAEIERNKYKTIEVNVFDKFFAVEYPPSQCYGHITTAMVAVFQGMLFWKEDCTYQFLEYCKNIEKEYKKKVHIITHEYNSNEKREYTVLNEPIKTKRLYYSKTGNLYSEAKYVQYNP